MVSPVNPAKEWIAGGQKDAAGAFSFVPDRQTYSAQMRLNIRAKAKDHGTFSMTASIRYCLHV